MVDVAANSVRDADVKRGGAVLGQAPALMHDVQLRRQPVNEANACTYCLPLPVQAKAGSVS